jgi:hypothetical protein
MAPSDSLPTAIHFPGSLVIGRLAPGPAGPGPGRASPVPATTFWPFHVPYAGGLFGTRSRSPGAFHGLRQIHTGSAPPCPAHAGILDDAADFALRCGPVSCSTSLQTPASRPTLEALLPGTLASSRTGLAPAGHRKLVARLRHVHSFAVMAPELLDARASRLSLRLNLRSTC